MERKSFRPECKALDEPGTVRFVVATLGQVDHDGDVTLPGFFGRQDVRMVPVHDWNHVPIGKGVLFEEGDSAIVEVKFNLVIPEAKSWYESIRFDIENPPALQEYSYGYEVLPGGYRIGDFRGQEVRYLIPCPDGSAGAKVFEVSPVLLGAGIGTGTLSVKEQAAVAKDAAAAPDGEAKTAAPPADPIAPHDTDTTTDPWSASGVVAGMKDATPTDLRSVFAWVDPTGDPAAKNSYKLAHHHGAGGPANIRACTAGIAALNAGTSGVPDVDRKAAYDHLAAHLRDADREPPALRDGPDTAPGGALKLLEEGAQVLAGVAAFVDRASEVMAIRAEKGRALAPVSLELLAWTDDELKRLAGLLAPQQTTLTADPATAAEDELRLRTVLAAVARVHNV